MQLEKMNKDKQSSAQGPTTKAEGNSKEEDPNDKLNNVEDMFYVLYANEQYADE